LIACIFKHSVYLPWHVCLFVFCVGAELIVACLIQIYFGIFIIEFYIFLTNNLRRKLLILLKPL
jgi:hypothetical protein